MKQDHVYGLIGVGLGVFNLALAAMLDENGYDDVLFFDRQAELNWHGGQLLDTSELQVHYLKDLVTPVDPTSKYTFLNYLSERGLLYQFMNRKSQSISRNQFQFYFRWVAAQLGAAHFGSEVESIRYVDEVFHVRVNGSEYRARNIAVATGLEAQVPECARELLGDRVFHIGEYTRRRHALGGRVVVVGGGQSGAEVVCDILEGGGYDSIAWLGRRTSFSQLEDNCFINELYVPSFTDRFRTLSSAHKLKMLQKLEMSSNGINQELLDRIYRLTFERRFFSGQEREYRFIAGQEMTGLRCDEGGYQVTMRAEGDGREWDIGADSVILATGFRPSSWNMLRGVIGDDSNDPCVGRSFQVQWPHQDSNDIFIQNGSSMCIGLADPNLSIAAWRASMIANRILGYERYATHPDTPIVDHLLMERA